MVLAAPHPEVNFVVTFMGDRLPDVRNGYSRKVPMALYSRLSLHKKPFVNTCYARFNMGGFGRPAPRGEFRSDFDGG